MADEFLAVKLHVHTTKDAFMLPINDKDPTAGKCMRISGEGSVMERLFTQPYIGSKSIPNYLHMADYMVSFMWQSCCGERAGSPINAVKTQGRTALSDESFNDSIFLTCNMPPLHLVNYDGFVKHCVKGGT